MPKKNENLSPEAAFWRAAGIEMPVGRKAADIARKSLKEHGANYVPLGESSDAVVIAADVIGMSLITEANARKNAAITLAWIDRTEGYKKAIAANGKPYTSTLAFARDVLPNLEKSTVANLIGAGRDVYTPAIEGKYMPDVNKVLLELNPSAAIRLKSTMGDKATTEERENTVKAVFDTYREKGTITKKDADEIAKTVKNPSAETAGGAVGNAVGRAKKLSRKELRDRYDATLRKVFPASNVILNDSGLTVTVPKEYINTLKTMLTVAETAENPDARVAIIGALIKALAL